MLDFDCIIEATIQMLQNHLSAHMTIKLIF